MRKACGAQPSIPELRARSFPDWKTMRFEY
jgi:hypothetical protein